MKSTTFGAMRIRAVAARIMKRQSRLIFRKISTSSSFWLLSARHRTLVSRCRWILFVVEMVCYTSGRYFQVGRFSPPRPLILQQCLFHALESP